MCLSKNMINNHMVSNINKILDKKGTCPSCHADSLSDVEYCTNFARECFGVECVDASESCPNKVIVQRCKDCKGQVARF